MVRMSFARLGSDSHTLPLICMRGCVVRYSKDWPPILNRVKLRVPDVQPGSRLCFQERTSSVWSLRSDKGLTRDHIAEWTKVSTG